MSESQTGALGQPSDSSKASDTAGEGNAEAESNASQKSTAAAKQPRPTRPVLDVFRRALGPAAKELKEEWSQTKAREDVRGLIAKWLLAILTVIVIGALADVSWLVVTGRGGQASDLITELRTVLELVVTPIVGLVGAATGFYFGTHAGDAKPAAGGSDNT